jgi:ribosomal-protein-alanine acetyltransferase
MNVGDLDEVLRIERASFEQPYSRAIIEQELKITAARVWVALHRGKIVAYIDFWVVKDEMELVSIAVSPRYKRRGVGDFMMQRMCRFADQQRARFIYLDVRQSNIAAQLLYAKFGFAKVGLRRRYYSDNQEDAIIMKKELE